jgi:nucleoside-diphosphate-sugar epimerase
MKKVLCIGGNGFIGSAYGCELSRHQFEVINYDLPEYSILDEKKLFNMIRQVDIVIHFAAMADITVCIKKLDETFETNVRGTYNVAKLCAQEYKPLIFISTCCVYGNSLDDLETEDYTAPKAAEPYACSKVAGEYILRGCRTLNMPCSASVRYTGRECGRRFSLISRSIELTAEKRFTSMVTANRIGNSYTLTTLSTVLLR